MGLMQQPAPEEAKDPRVTDETDSNVSPEEQAQYSQFEQNYLSLIYDGKGDVNPGILEALGKDAPEAAVPEETGEPDAPDAQEVGKSPPEIMALANTAIMIVSKLDDSAREAGQPLSDDVLVQGGIAVIEELAEVAEAAGIHDFSEEELNGAATVAMDMYRDKAIQDGRTDEETLKGQWGQVVEADQAGQLDSVIPGMAQQGA